MQLTRSSVTAALAPVSVSDRKDTIPAARLTCQVTAHDSLSTVLV
jgi:hypothetical protein